MNEIIQIQGQVRCTHRKYAMGNNDRQPFGNICQTYKCIHSFPNNVTSRNSFYKHSPMCKITYVQGYSSKI